jgi:hypothetical protein
MASKKARSIVGYPLTPSVLDELGAWGSISSSRFSSSGHWTNVYRIWACQGYRESGNEDRGILNIERLPSSAEDTFTFFSREESPPEGPEAVFLPFCVRGWGQVLLGQALTAIRPTRKKLKRTFPDRPNGPRITRQIGWKRPQFHKMALSQTGELRAGLRSYSCCHRPEQHVILSVATGFVFHELYEIPPCCLGQCARLISFQLSVDFVVKRCVEVHSVLPFQGPFFSWTCRGRGPPLPLFIFLSSW